MRHIVARGIESRRRIGEHLLVVRAKLEGPPKPPLAPFARAFAGAGWPGLAGSLAATLLAVASELPKSPTWRVNLISFAETLPVKVTRTSLP